MKGLPVIKGLTSTFAESFLALANSRSVNYNNVIFNNFMEVLLKTDFERRTLTLDSPPPPPLLRTPMTTA